MLYIPKYNFLVLITHIFSLFREFICGLSHIWSRIRNDAKYRKTIRFLKKETDNIQKRRLTHQKGHTAKGILDRKGPVPAEWWARSTLIAGDLAHYKNIIH